MIINAINRRWIENKNDKHKYNASDGWYRYDTYSTMPVKGSEEEVGRYNKYKATLVVRKKSNGYFSNWYLPDFEIGGVKYSSMEQYIHWH